MKFPAFVLFLIFASFLGGCGLRAEESWSYQWDAVVLPNSQDSFWIRRGDGEAKVREDGLFLSTAEEQALIFVVTEAGSHGVWDGTAPTVIEFSAQTLPSTSKYASGAHLSVSDGVRSAAVKIRGEPNEHYRLEWKDGDARLWINGAEANELVQIISFEPDQVAANCLYFGDESIYVGGDSLWHYIRWKPLQP